MSKQKSGLKKAGSKKGRRQTANRNKSKHSKAFIRCVKKTGKWRGKSTTIDQVR